MEFTIHHGVLLAAFAIAAVMGAVMAKTHFCTMGGVSDWVNIGDTGRMRAWVFSMAVALAGVLALEAAGTVNLYAETFPPYRTANFAWLRYILGGILFGVGMTLASGCGTRTMVRIGGGNVKSLVVLGFGAIAAYLMMWTAMFEKAFMPWIAPTTVNLAPPRRAEPGALHRARWHVRSAGSARHCTSSSAPWSLPACSGSCGSRWISAATGTTYWAGRSSGSRVFAGWWLTGGPLGKRWKEYADMATEIPSRVRCSRTRS